MRKYRFGIMGTGLISDFHAKALNETDNAELVACYDRNTEKARIFAKKYGCSFCATQEEFLQNMKLDVVNICTPTGFHLDPALDVIKAGIDLLIVKPLETTVERSHEIIRKAAEKKVALGCIYPFRYHHNQRELKRIIDEGHLGRLYHGEAHVKWYRSQEYYDGGEWRGTWDVDGGGSLMNQSIHAVDLLQWYMGEVTELSGFTETIAHKNIEVEDNAAAILRFKNGALGMIHGSTAISPGYPISVQISGANGTVMIKGDDAFIDVDASVKGNLNFINKIEMESQGGSDDPGNIDYLDHRDLFEHFIEVHKKTGAWPVNGLEAVKSIELITGVYKSHAQRSIYEVKRS